MRFLVVLSRNRRIDHTAHRYSSRDRNDTRKNLNSLFHVHFCHRTNDYLFIYLFMSKIKLRIEIIISLLNFQLQPFFSSSRSNFFDLFREQIQNIRGRNNWNKAATIGEDGVQDEIFAVLCPREIIRYIGLLPVSRSSSVIATVKVSFLQATGE